MLILVSCEISETHFQRGHLLLCIKLFTYVNACRTGSYPWGGDGAGMAGCECSGNCGCNGNFLNFHDSVAQSAGKKDEEKPF